MTIQEYHTYDPGQVLPLYAAVGWTNYTQRPDMLERAFRGSLLVLGAWDGDKLVGLLRAVGDGASILFLQDILVLPDYQRRGIGSALVREALRRFPNVYQVELAADNAPRLAAFYRSLGFRSMEESGCLGFMKM